MPSLLRSALFALLPAAALASNRSYISTLSYDAQGLLNESMSWMDTFYDSSAGYLHDLSAATALNHETRSSAWYAIGLLARAQGNDVDEALKIITNVIGGQYKVKEDQWYGDYQQEPEEPEIGSPDYPPSIYGSWDPNWRGFVGTTFIVGLEEFGHLITPEVTCLMLESLKNATIGDSYRVGGVDGDNLYPAYSNPSIMRAFVSGWVGRRINDTNMTAAGELYATEIYDLFERANTLSEFNSGTYTGVSLFALSLWGKYMPETSIMGQKGPEMIKYTWASASQLWHPDLKNVAGPWDRSYGFDMNRYVSILALHLWTIIGKQKSSLIANPQVMSHSADFAIAPLIAVLAEYQNSLLSTEVLARLNTFSGEHTFTSSTYSPPFDVYPRNITAWLSTNLTIGAETFNETVIGGPAKSTNSFRPALIQWQTGNNEIGFIALQASEPAITAVAGNGTLDISYPYWTNASTFQLLVSPFNITPWKAKKQVSSWSDMVGLNVSVSGNVNMTYTLSFAGIYGGSDDLINNFEFWNFTYAVPANLTEQPYLKLKVELA